MAAPVVPSPTTSRSVASGSSSWSATGSPPGPPDGTTACSTRGARYAVNDPESAVECIRENRILRRIAPGSFEENDGLFVALDDADMAFREQFLPACEASGIPVRWLSPAEALRCEPRLDPDSCWRRPGPDGTMDAMRLPLRFFATALAQRRRHPALHRGRRA